MRKYYLFIALAMVAAMTVSCKNNNKKAKEAADATAEVVEAAKTILADDVLATIDELAQSYINDGGELDFATIISSALTEEEKLIKPDYLLEASQANEMVTKSQKLNALAILMVERPVRIAYGMPTEDTDEVIARLVADVNDPVSFDDEMSLTPAEKIKMAYEAHKERGDIADFWQFGFAAQIESGYLISRNLDVVFRNLNEEQFATLNERFITVKNAASILAEYDPEIKQVWDAVNAGGKIGTHFLQNTKEYAKNFFTENASVYAARRANLLK